MSCAHVIMLNDRPIAAVTVGSGSTNAYAFVERQLERLKSHYYFLNRGTFRSEQDYKQRCHWHIETVPAEEAP